MVTKKTETGNPNTITVTLRDLVNAEAAMLELSVMPLTGKVSYRIGKAIKKAESEVEIFRLGVSKLLRVLGAQPNKQGGLTLDETDEKYDKNWKKLTDHRQNALDETVTLEGVVTVTVEELMAAMPLPEVKCLKCDLVTEYTDEEKADKSIKPFILGALGWLIVE